MHSFVQISFDENKQESAARESDIKDNHVTFINKHSETQTFQCCIDIIYSTETKSRIFPRNDINSQAADRLRKLFGNSNGEVGDHLTQPKRKKVL